MRARKCKNESFKSFWYYFGNCSITHFAYYSNFLFCIVRLFRFGLVQRLVILNRGFDKPFVFSVTGNLEPKILKHLNYKIEKYYKERKEILNYGIVNFLQVTYLQLLHFVCVKA